MNTFLNSFLFLINNCSVRSGNATRAIATPNKPIGNWINLSDKYNHVGLPDIRNDAKIVSTKTLSWQTPAARIAGKNLEKNEFRTFVSYFFVKDGKYPSVLVKYKFNKSCIAPATITAVPIMPKESSSEKQAKTIKVKLNNIGVAATT